MEISFLNANVLVWKWTTINFNIRIDNLWIPLSNFWNVKMSPCISQVSYKIREESKKFSALIFASNSLYSCWRDRCRSHLGQSSVTKQKSRGTVLLWYGEWKSPWQKHVNPTHPWLRLTTELRPPEAFSEKPRRIYREEIRNHHAYKASPQAARVLSIYSDYTRKL